jgi:L-threonylcarbamoyladenylate synthase
VAVRVPAHPVAHALLLAAGIPVAAPSANLFSRPSPTQAAHVLEDLDGRIDMVIDGGPTQVGVESTVLDLSGDVPQVLRPGASRSTCCATLLPDVRARAPRR